MKKYISSALIFVLCALLCVFLCACEGGTAPTEAETEIAVTEAPQKHTLPPTEATPALEWCPVEDCKLFFNDSDGVTVLNERDISMFALSGSDDNAVMVFKLSEQAKAMMEAAEPTESFTVVLNDEEIGTAYFSNNKEDLTLSGLGFDRLCEIASTIRGLG